MASTSTAEHDTSTWFPWCGEIEDRDQLSKVQDDVYLTSWRGAEKSDELRRLGVTHFVCCMEEPCGQGEDSVAHPGFEVLTLILTDVESQEMTSAITRGVDFMTEACRSGGKVLVHCAAGISRSTTTVLAFLMRTRGMTLINAFALTRNKRPVVWPNDGFMSQLANLEMQVTEREKPSIDPKEYAEWGLRDHESYAAAKIVDRPK